MAGDWRQWRGFALEEAEILGGRLKDLLSSGQAFVRSRLGWDLGLEPEFYPTWLVLTTAALGALLVLAAFLATVCGGGGGDRRRKRSAPPPVTLRGGGEVAAKTPLVKAPLTKTAKPEETKKKNVKKAGDKKPQPNGQLASAVVVQQEVKVLKVLSRQPPPPAKTRKAPQPQEQLPAQVKKDKKKSKTNVKAAPYVITLDGKEPDEGTWETKVSNREKKQQRRKDKGPETYAGPEGTNAGKSHVKKKNTGAHESQPSKSAAKASAAGQGGDGVDFSDKTSASAESAKWGSRHRGRGEPRTQESQGGNAKSDLDPVSYSALRQNAAEPVEPQWTNRADDQWGGSNGADPGSDWNAPAEHWGNYEEPPVAIVLLTQLMERPSAIKVTSGENDGQDPAGGAATAKKRRKRKKKSEEEAASETVKTAHKFEDVPVVASQKLSISSSRQRPERITAAETAKKDKKKVRRET
ncbi:metadherin a isoform X2 [Corythoichthys intestinalis]|uniref:metadherin a isoform X2 n=1 Tax=Corythoichthys intestinalis TaxID=161448 RepID=UPI0025A4DA42|nr:metadherin a isoform X2 [Corythoichthys intestinalis]